MMTGNLDESRKIVTGFIRETSIDIPLEIMEMITRFHDSEWVHFFAEDENDWQSMLHWKVPINDIIPSYH